MFKMVALATVSSEISLKFHIQPGPVRHKTLIINNLLNMPAVNLQQASLCKTLLISSLDATLRVRL
jgi:hypothetical protein